MCICRTCVNMFYPLICVWIHLLAPDSLFSFSPLFPSTSLPFSIFISLSGQPQADGSSCFLAPVILVLALGASGSGLSKVPRDYFNFFWLYMNTTELNWIEACLFSLNDFGRLWQAWMHTAVTLFTSPWTKTLQSDKLFNCVQWPLSVYNSISCSIP